MCLSNFKIDFNLEDEKKLIGRKSIILNNSRINFLQGRILKSFLNYGFD